ncbi:hypothetical protein UPYG_G00088710 [Umbra pygmaea]|uniref:Uncharacterized protein n=1 Tax=Umbra pygmaea TaxID=75934 RepID=A0ABD0XI81_UMBPY
MSGHLLRRNSSKAGLQNLLRVTAQRSVEDAEEIERERRRRARERQMLHNDTARSESATPTSPAEDDGPLEVDAVFKCDLKASGGQLALEEDEGFSDWTQRLEKRRQRHLEEQQESREAPPPQNQKQWTQPINGVGPTRPCLKTGPVSEPEDAQDWEQKASIIQEASRRGNNNKVAEKKKSELKISYTSKVMRHVSRNGDTAVPEVTSYLVAGKMTPR